MDRPVEREHGEEPGQLIVCRCEEVTAAEIEAAIKEGYISLDAVKRATRAGMGPCQGRTCGRIVRQMLSRATGRQPAELPPATFRPPLRPCKLSILADFSADSVEIPGTPPEQEAE